MRPLLRLLLLTGLFGVALGLLSAAGPKERSFSGDKADLQGQWKAVATKGFSKDVPREELQTLSLTFRGDHLTAHYGQKTAAAIYRLILTEAGPSRIDVTVTQGPAAVQDKTLHGIYLLEGNTLKILYRNPGQARPSTFMDEDEPGVHMVFLKKERSK